MEKIDKGLIVQSLDKAMLATDLSDSDKKVLAIVKNAFTSGITETRTPLVNEEETIKRISYVFNDINAIPENERIDYEVLANYDTLDIVLIGKDNEQFSIKETITNSVIDKLNGDHLKLKNQHALATEENSGFMSATDKVLLKVCSDTVNELYSIINGTKESEPFTLGNVSYLIEKDNTLKVSSRIENGNFIIPLDGEINIGNRPEKAFINAGKNGGYRDDLVAIQIHADSYEYSYFDNIIFGNDEVIIATQSYKYDNVRHIYCDENKTIQIIPVFLIRRRNNELINNNNIMGKLDNTSLSSVEIFEIYRAKLKEITKQKLLMDAITDIKNKENNVLTDDIIFSTNLEPKTPKDYKLFIPLNGNEMDFDKNFSLNKGCSFTNSPYGEMMKSAIRLGNAITFRTGDKLRVDFLLKLTGKKTYAQSILKLKTSLMIDRVNIQYLDNKKLRFEINGAKYDIELDKNVDYHNISFMIADHLAYIFSNNIIKQTIKLPETYKVNDITNVSVASSTVPIGNIIISEDISFINPDVTKHSKLLERFNALTAKDTLNSKTLTFKFGDYALDQDVKCEFKIQNKDKLTAGDTINIFFDNDLVDYYYDGFVIDRISSNRVSLIGKHNFKVNDIVKITKNNINLEQVYTIIDVIDSFILLDKPIPTEFKGFKMVDIFSALIFEATTNGKILPTCARDSYVSIFIKEDLPLDSVFTIKMVEKIGKSDILEQIDRIDSVILNGDNVVSKRTDDKISDIDLGRLNIYFKGEKLTGDFTNGVVIEDSKLNNIILDTNIDIKDLFANFSMRMIDEVLDFENGFIELAVGKGNVLKINGNVVPNSGDGMNKIPINFSDFNIVNSELRLKITISKTQDEPLYVYINKFNINIKFKKGDVYTTMDNTGSRIVNFLLANKNGIFNNIEQKLDIIVREKADRYSIESISKPISEIIDGYRLVSSVENIMKVEQCSTGRIYDLKHNYII